MSVTTMSSYGMRVGLPDRWDGRGFQPAGTGPTVHAGNFGIPVDASNLGGAAVEAMRPGNVFLAIVEYVTQTPRASGPFSHERVPSVTLTQGSFADDLLHGGLRPGLAGRQDIFCVGQRCFMLYAVLYRALTIDAGAIGGLQNVIEWIEVDDTYAPQLDGRVRLF